MCTAALVVKNLLANAGDVRDAGSIPGSWRFPGGGHGNPVQYSCLENPMDREGWWAMVHKVAKSRTWLKRLSIHGSKGKARFIILDLLQVYQSLISNANYSYYVSLKWTLVKYGNIYYGFVEFIQPKFLIAFSTYIVLWISQYCYQWEKNHCNMENNFFRKNFHI